MSRFVCDICGEEVAVHEGILTWARDDETLSNFTLTHKNSPERNCQPANNNRFKDLYTLTMIHGYLEFIAYLVDRWESGFFLRDAESLKKVLEQLNLHMHEKIILLTEEEN
ncbi:hypothetical protein [Desulfallas thermosapovorans]|uniref:Uncharacterized protein n=1 Tax=Desulfallas thermosapovorans DSM 6562 TaxID=1121431 RepID=A0A5S4ZYJ9_9FIRM|nr:hypothetical protein [Desulfallas thermosapovorans]TYO97988.1 hypothetical protein LX24_00272 [Desulfallas thermosapovorans DSM 6562]